MPCPGQANSALIENGLFGLAKRLVLPLRWLLYLHALMTLKLVLSKALRLRLILRLRRKRAVKVVEGMMVLGILVLPRTLEPRQTATEKEQAGIPFPPLCCCSMTAALPGGATEPGSCGLPSCRACQSSAAASCSAYAAAQHHWRLCSCRAALHTAEHSPCLLCACKPSLVKATVTEERRASAKGT